jgi:hypothetical protein
MRNVMYAAPLTGKAPTDAALLIAEHAWLAHLVAAVTLAVELGFLSVLVWPRVRPLFVTAVIALHTSIWLTHGLDYSVWAGTAIVLLVDWGAVIDRHAPAWVRRRWAGPTPADRPGGGLRTA